MKNNIYSVVAMGVMLLAVQLIAVSIAPIYSTTQSEAMGGRETIENPGFAFLYLGVILAFTFAILWIAKKKKEKFIKILILAAIFMTMTYLFIPLTIAALYPSGGGGWEINDIGHDVFILNAGDIDDDGVVEVIAGCSDNRVRVYESENHTLEWESAEFGSNISQILVGDVDFDGTQDVVVFSQGITVYNGTSKSEKWSYAATNISTGALLPVDEIGKALLAGTSDGKVMILANDTIIFEYDLSTVLNNITFLQACYDEVTENITVIAADTSTIVVFNARTLAPEIDLEITELEEVRALTVYQDPNGEDYIIAADGERCYVYNLTSETYERKGPKLRDIRAVYLEDYSIPDFDDDVPDVIVLGEDTIYIIPDLVKDEKGYYYLSFRYDLNTILSADLDGDGSKELLLGNEDGYKHTTIVFSEGPNLLIPFVIAIVTAFSLTMLVHKFPEWYVVDVVGIVMAIGATVILGVTFSILPAIVLLIVLAVYDAISVYKTKHMISLADSVIELNLPVLLVVPKTLSYSYRKEKPRLKEQLDSGEEREAMFMGLGDIVIPGLLAVSALAFLPATQSGVGITGNILVAFGTMIGILFGFSILMRFVMKGNPQAGLPLLNSGAVIGYMLAYLIVFGDFGFGFNLNF
ncbi:MAG: hypothetical protein JSW28_04275 [Thermoplasmata archaeon]|nr:MAG: hypothetical protein JSW28_04275 [Thermoplasmata archaeon]